MNLSANMSLVNVIRSSMLDEARSAALARQKSQGGDWSACGFAWVTIYPKHKGTTLEGKKERHLYKALGFEKDYTGKSYQLWNPSGLGVQSVDIKDAGAVAAANVLRRYDIEAYAGSRLD